jgi:hypothetical protein
MRTSTLLGLVALNFAFGCAATSGEPSPTKGEGDGTTAPAPPAATETGPAPSQPAGGSSGGFGTVPETPAPTPATPVTAVTVTGTAEVTCMFLSSYQQSYCHLTPTSLVFTPPAAAGAKLSDYLNVAATNDANTAAGWTTGLTITSPDTGECLATLSKGGSATFLALGVYTQSPTKQLCGLKDGGLVPNDFAGHFKAKVPSASYYPAGNAASGGSGAALNVALTIDLTIN